MKTKSKIITGIIASALVAITLFTLVACGGGTLKIENTQIADGKTETTVTFETEGNNKTAYDVAIFTKAEFENFTAPKTMEEYEGFVENNFEKFITFEADIDMENEDSLKAKSFTWKGSEDLEKGEYVAVIFTITANKSTKQIYDFLSGLDENDEDFEEKMKEFTDSIKYTFKGSKTQNFEVLAPATED